MSKHSIIKSATLTIMTAAMSVFAAAPAFAFIEGEFSVGNRTGSFKSDGSSSKSLSGTSIQLAGHLDPIPFVPVAFGLRILNETFKPSVADHGLKTLTSTAFVPEVEAWLPLGDLKPFARIGYTLVSAYKGSMDLGPLGSGDVAYKSTGTRLAAGINYSLLPLISFTAAFEQSNETFSVSDLKISGVDKSQVPDVKFNSTAITVGVKAGI